MTDYENWTDEALRAKLQEYGFPVMPITITTRKIMVKKLRLLQENKHRANAQERKTLAKYSSDDDSDLERRTKPRRATVAPLVATQQTNGNSTQRRTQFPPVNSNKERKKSRVVVEVKRYDSSDTEPEVFAHPKSTKTVIKSHKSVGTYQQPSRKPTDDVDGSEEEDSIGLNLQNFSNTSTYSSYNSASDDVDSPPKLFTTAPRTLTPSVQRPKAVNPASQGYRPGVLQKGASSAYSAFKSNITLGELSSTPGDDNPPPVRQRSYGYLAHERQRQQEKLSDEDTPYLSNFSKRLSMLTSQDLQRDGQKRVKVRRGPPAENGNILSRNLQRVVKYFRSETKHRYSTNTNCRSTSTALKTEENTGNFISLALVAAVGMFFIVLVALYYGLHRGSNTNDITGLIVPRCSSKVTTNCLTRDEEEGGIDLYKIFKPKLIQLAIDFQCGDFVSPSIIPATSSKKAKFYMTDSDIMRFIKDNYKIQNEHAIAEDIDSFVLIAHHNQFLGVSVLKVHKNGDSDEYFIVDDVKQANNELSNEEYIRAFAVLSPSLPWRCSLWQKVTACLRAGFVILSVAAVLYFSKFAYKWLKYYQHKRKEQVVMLVEKILEIMQTQTEDDQFLVINHVRDMLIPIDQRKKMETSWKKAITFINENESRIRTEVQVVKGESYEVWRWIGGQSVSPNTSGVGMVVGGAAAASAANKSWQGQAFEVQTPPCSPTPCLKVRGMIDDADRNCNKAAIRDAILLKCGQCRVLHVSVDIGTKCVYIKCADTNDAAIAYRSLHGNWFAGHLVTVKYLRLERYMQRFPDSPVSGPPFLKA